MATVRFKRDIIDVASDLPFLRLSNRTPLECHYRETSVFATRLQPPVSGGSLSQQTDSSTPFLRLHSSEPRHLPSFLTIFRGPGRNASPAPFRLCKTQPIYLPSVLQRLRLIYANPFTRISQQRLSSRSLSILNLFRRKTMNFVFYRKARARGERERGSL